MALAVDRHNTSRFVVSACSEDGLAGDAVHEDAAAGLQVVHVDKAILGDHEDHTVFLRHLQSDGEIAVRFLREKDIDRLLLEHRIRLGVIDLDNVELGAGGSPCSKCEELGVLGCTFQSQSAESRGVALDSLADTAVLRVKLHGTNDAALLLGNANNYHPLPVGVDPVVDNLASLAEVSFIDDGN